MAAIVDDNSIRNLWGILHSRKNSPRNTATNPTINATHPQPLATTSTPTPAPNHVHPYANPQRIPYRKDAVYVYRQAKDAISEEYRNRFPIVQDILRRNIEHDPKKKLLKYTALLSYELQMCGVSREDAKPSILVNCPYNETILKRLKSLFLQPHVKDQYHIDVPQTPTTPYVPRFRLFFWAEERQNIWGRSDFVTIDTRGQHEPEQVPKHPGLTMCGARVVAGEFGERCSTVGCLLRVGTQYYGLTSAHTFEEWTPPPTDFEEDSDDDSDFEDDEYDLNLPYPDDDGSSPSSLRLDEGSVDPGSEHAREKALKLPNALPKHGIISPPVDDDTWTSRHPDRDWALVQVTDPSYWRPNVYSSPSEPHVPKFFSKFAPRLPTESRGVYLVSSRSPAQYGTLHPIPSYIGGHGARTCEVWTVSLSENQFPRKGDSGSIVIDARTKEVYGHAVAVTPLRDFYVVPLKDTLMEIQELLGTTDVDFPCNATLLANLMFHYATTRPQSEELQHTIQALQRMAEREENSRQLQEALERYLKSIASRSSEGRYSTIEVPSPSGSLDSLPDEEALEFEFDHTLTSTSAPPDITRPHIVRQDSVNSRSRGRERHITPLSLSTQFYLAPLATRAEEPKPATTIQEITTSFMESQSSADAFDRSAQPASTNSASGASSITSVVRGFSPSHISSSYRSIPLLTAPPSIPTTDLTDAPASKGPQPKKQQMFALGGSSGEDSLSEQPNSIDSKLVPQQQKKSAMFSFGGSSNEDESSLPQKMQTRNGLSEQYLTKNKKQTSFGYEVVTRTINEERFDDDDDFSEWDDSSEWEDSVEDSGNASIDEKTFLQRGDSRPNLTSRRSLITTMLHQNDRANTLANPAAASRSTSALQRSRTSSPNGPSLGTSPDSDDAAPLMMKKGLKPIPEARPEIPRSAAQPIIQTTTNSTPHQQALSPRSTRRHMLASELTDSLRRQLLWERKQKSQTANAVLKRRHTAHDVANLKQYPEKVYMNGEDKEGNKSTWNDVANLKQYPEKAYMNGEDKEGNKSTWNEYYGQDLGEYLSQCGGPTAHAPA